MRKPWVQQYRVSNERGDPGKKGADERGGATVEITLLTPLLIMFLLVVVLVGRSVSTKLDVDAAASDAARAASLERSPEAAQVAATDTVNSNVSSNTKGCRTMTAEVNTSDFHAGGAVSVDVICTIDISDLSLLRIAGTRTIRSHATEPIDTYRSAS